MIPGPPKGHYAVSWDPAAPGMGCGATWTATPEGMSPVVRFEWATTDGELTETRYSVRGEPAPVLDLVHRLALGRSAATVVG